VAGFCECGTETSGSIKCGGISCLSEELLVNNPDCASCKLVNGWFVQGSN
jgi:hypothetical protein